MKAYPLCATVDVRVRDGRLVQVATVGDPRGRTVVLHHGTPGSRLFVENLRSLTEAGLFIICHSRPGYGRSTSHPGRRVADVVADVEDVLDVMGRDAYVSVGHSGGGPHALACAALDERCLAGWSISGLAPFQGFDWSEDKRHRVHSSNRRRSCVRRAHEDTRQRDGGRRSSLRATCLRRPAVGGRSRSYRVGLLG